MFLLGDLRLSFSFGEKNGFFTRKSVVLISTWHLYLCSHRESFEVETSQSLRSTLEKQQLGQQCRVSTFNIFLFEWKMVDFFCAKKMRGKSETKNDLDVFFVWLKDDSRCQKWVPFGLFNECGILGVFLVLFLVDRPKLLRPQ